MGALGLPQSAWTNGAHTICTSATRPPAPNDGDIIFETDTRYSLRYDASDLTWKYQPRGVIGHAKRTVTSGASLGGEVPVLRIPPITVKAGAAYWVRTSNMLAASTVAGDVAGFRFRYTTNGTTPTTASTNMAFATVTLNSGGQGATLVSQYWTPTSDQQLSVLLSVQRVGGTGSVTIIAATGFEMDIVIDHVGHAPANTGVNL